MVAERLTRHDSSWGVAFADPTGDVSMQPYQWSLAGLVVDIVGAFFLSVEAIKLENLAKIRDHVLLPLHANLRPVPITVLEDGSWLMATKSKSFGMAMLIWTFWHFLGGALLVGVVLWAIHGTFHFDLLGWAWALRDLLAPWARLPITALSCLFAFVLTTSFPGEVAHKGTEQLSLWLLNAFYWIDRRTPDGTIGIIGFCLLSLGFLGQVIGTWLGRVSVAS